MVMAITVTISSKLKPLARLRRWRSFADYYRELA
jgi:hypothetical protein